MLQNQILEVLEANRDHRVTGGELARRLGVSRTAVWKAVNALREAGNDIESARNSGYRLVAGSDGLSEQAVLPHLTTERLGRSLEVKQLVSSTNQYLKGLDLSALPEGHAVLAEEQSGGRGRLGRSFHSPARQGVYLSILLKPAISLAQTPILTLCAAVAACRAVEAVSGAAPGIKWVNDLYLGGKKLCGILTEAGVTAELQGVDYAVVGIGVNTGRVDPAIADIATSIEEHTGRRVLRSRLAAEILNQMERLYLDFAAGGDSTAILVAYSERLIVCNKAVRVVQPGGDYVATALGVDETGGLLVRLPNGERRTVRTGEIQILEADERTCQR